MSREYAAIYSLLHRSGVTDLTQLHKAINSRQFHSSPQNNQELPKGNNGQKKSDNNDEDKDKISALLAKALLWMLTGYMVIAVISLMFPTSNQPEVGHKNYMCLTELNGLNFEIIGYSLCLLE